MTISPFEEGLFAAAAGSAVSNLQLSSSSGFQSMQRHALPTSLHPITDCRSVQRPDISGHHGTTRKEHTHASAPVDLIPGRIPTQSHK